MKFYLLYDNISEKFLKSVLSYPEKIFNREPKVSLTHSPLNAMRVIVYPGYSTEYKLRRFERIIHLFNEYEEYDFVLKQYKVIEDSRKGKIDDFLDE